MVPFNATDHVAAMLWEGKEERMVNSMVADKAESFGWYRDSLLTGQQIAEATQG